MVAEHGHRACEGWREEKIPKWKIRVLQLEERGLGLTKTGLHCVIMTIL